MTAQVAGQANSDLWADGTSKGADDNRAANADDNGSSPANPDYRDWPVFTIPGVASLGDMSGSGIVFGSAFSGGYGWVNDGAQQNTSGSITVAQPYLGIFHSGYRHKVLLEYSPTVDLFNQSRWDGGVLQRMGLSGYTDLTKQVRWVFSAYATEGTEYLREVGGIAMGDYPGFLTFSRPSDTRLLASALTGLNWRLRPRREFLLTVGGTYSATHHGPQYDATVVRAQMSNYLGHYSKWYTYAQANRYSDQTGCTRVGAGGGFAWKATAATTVSLEAGPEYGSGRCSLKLSSSFRGTLAQHIKPKTVLYLGANRDLSEPYLLQSRWTDIYSAKIWQKTSQNTDFTLGSGYALSSNLPGQTVPYYRGFLVSSEFQWRLSSSASMVGSYRYFKRDLNVGDPNLKVRNSWVFLSLVWHPVSRGTGRS